MAKNKDPNAGTLNSSDLIPRFYRSDANKKFLQSTVDQLVQPGTVKKVNGYIGRQNAKAATSADIFVEAVDANRQNYQLEPGFIVKDSLDNTTFFKDYQDYINQLNIFGANTSNHSRINNQEFYSWNPHINWDKFVNFQNYYWLPYGPSAIKIAGQAQQIVSTYTVIVESELDNNVYLFTPDGLTRNPTLKLFKGQTYKFNISSPGNPFSIKTARIAGALDRYQSLGLAYAVENGILTFTVPHDSPDVLYYLSETDANLGGVIHVLSIEENSVIDVEKELLGKQTYTLPSGLQLSNGMKVEFVGTVSPSSYASSRYYVEGVGTAIKLVNEKSLEIISAYTDSQSILFDSVPFDSMPFSDATSFAGKPDYIVINRSSTDQNPWSRYNRWFHKDTINTSAAFNNIIPSLDQTARAVRPIIEFDAGLKLFNFGLYATPDVDLVDTYTTDVFSIIEGSAGYNIDGVSLATGHRILFTADTDNFVKNNIYRVEFIDVRHLNEGSRQIHLVLESTPSLHEVVLVKQGNSNQGETYWYDGTTWNKAQSKTLLNQSPLFDIVDDTGISYSDNSVYNGSSFKGTKLFSYKIGTGTVDSNLGFPLSYKNINNIGDIVFNFNLITDSFQFKDLTNIITKDISVGYLIKLNYANDITYVNGWETSTVTNTQGAIRIYNNSNLTNNFPIDIFDDKTDLTDLTVKIYVNGIRLNRDLWTVVDAPTYKEVVLSTDLLLTDVLTIKAFASQPINNNGYYEIPINLQNNPFNNAMIDFTLGEVIDHVGSIVDNLPSFVGSFPGAGNLQDLGNVTQYGTKFVQHSGPMSLSLYHITSESNNIVRAIDSARANYNNFKRNFLSVSSLLGVDTDTVSHVNLILQEINKDKPTNSAYYFSDMVGSTASIKNDYTVLDYRIKTYPLASAFNLDALSNKAVYVYHNGTHLLYGRDYSFSDQGFIIISANIAEDDIISIHEYESTDGCFIPATPTKLGIWPKFEPKIYLDTSLITPRMMIQGHDGSQLLSYGDFRDDLLLELEKRIYNNIKVKYDANIFDINKIIPLYNKSSEYSLTEFNQVLAPNFYKWTSLVDRDFTKPLSYDRNNTMTFNYRGHVAPDGRETPGYWRGIYRWLLGTDRPNICPWEILGLSEEPSWWQSVYGPAPYTRDNLVMWTDLSEGMLRVPGVPAVKLTDYIRPYLISCIPVDDQGNIISPYQSNLSTGVLTATTTGDFIFGDVSPVEATWRRSSHYPFAILITAMLTAPSQTFGVLLDRSRIIRNLTGQLVNKDTGLRIKPADVVLPSIYSSTTRVQTSGIINYIVDYILGDNLKSYAEYQYDLANIDGRLSHRLGGFTSKEKFNLLLDSKTPLSSGSVFVPQEDYDIILNSSSPVKKITYSGVIITKLADGFEVKGYSKTQPYFTCYPWLQSGVTINVGGISETYTTWTIGQQYAAGKIVLYNSRYYRTKVLHTTTANFEMQYYQSLGMLPMIGGRDAILRKSWDKTSQIIVPYGTKFRTIQEIVDFLTGYGEYLKGQGFIFDDFNNNMARVTNWETSAREFLFWTTQNWSSGKDKWKDWLPDTDTAYNDIVRYNGDYYQAIRKSFASSYFIEDDFIKLEGLSTVGSSVISLSPAANKLTFSTPFSTVDDINNEFNGYEIFKVDGTPIPTNFLNSYRDDSTTSYSPQGSDGIYGASFYLIQKEQVVIFNNSTMFNDTIYNPESGYRQERIKVAGYLSTNWNGTFSSPGFIFDQAKIQDWSTWIDYALGDVVKYKEFYYSASGFIPGSQSFEPASWIKLAEKPVPKLLPNWTYKASQFEDFYSLDSDNFDVGQQRMAQHLIGYQKRQYLSNIIKDDVSEFKFYQGMIIEKGTQNSLNKLFDVLSADGQESLKFHEEWAVRVGLYGANAAFENIEFILNEDEFKNNPQGIELVNVIDTSKVDFIYRQIPTDIYLKPLGYNNNPWPTSATNKLYLRTPGYVREDDVQFVLKDISEILTKDITQIKNNDYVWCGFEGREWNIYRYVDADIKVTNVSYDINKKELTIETSELLHLSAGTYIGISNVSNISNFYKIDSVVLNKFILSGALKNVASPFTEHDTIRIFVLTSYRIPSMDMVDSVLTKDASTGDLIWTDDSGDGKWATWEYDPAFVPGILYNPDPTDNQGNGANLAVTQSGTFAASVTLTGEIFVYDKITSSLPWSHRQTISKYLINTGTFDSDSYTHQIVAFSADGTWLATGCTTAGDNITPVPEQGAVLIYKKDDTNNYTIVATIISPDPQAYEHFGSKLTFGDNRLFIGAGLTTGDIGRVYQANFATRIKASKTFNPNGGVGRLVTLSDNIGIEVGMRVSGVGFTSNQYVTAVAGSSTIIVSADPDETPSGILNFTVDTWEILPTQVLNDNTEVNGKFSYDIVVSTDASMLAVSAPDISTGGKVFVYEYNNGIYELYDILVSEDRWFGQSITISDNGEYISVSSVKADGTKIDEGSVIVYKKLEVGYSVYQTIRAHNPEVLGYFGTKIAFMNDYKTLVVFSKNADIAEPLIFSDATIFDDDTTTFFLSNNIDTGRVDIYDRYASRWVFSESLLETELHQDMYGTSIAVANNTILVSAPLAIAGGISSGVVHNYSKNIDTYSWNIKNKEIAQPSIEKIKSVFLYNKKTTELIGYLDVIDPVQGKIAGPAEQELKYKTFYDPAMYSIGDSRVNVDDGMAWTKAQVGMLWWDLRTAKFIDTYDNDLIYRNSNWNKLFPGASIDIYEWVETTLLPSAWDSKSDTEAGIALGISGQSLYGDTVYSISKKYDTVSKTFKNTYYYWIKNKKTIPNVQSRKLSAQNVANLISNPRGEGYQYMALTSSNSFSLVNVKPDLESKDVVLSVEYWLIKNQNQNIHSEWKIISDDINSQIPARTEEKWFDSLCGKDANDRLIPDLALPPKLRYGIEFRPRQGMFINRFEALKQFVEQVNITLVAAQITEQKDLSKLELYETEPFTSSGLYDAAVDTDSELRFASVGSFRRAELTAEIVNGSIVGVTVVSRGSGYIYAPYITIVGAGINAKIKTIINVKGQITGVDIINKGTGYNNNTTLIIRDYSVLVHSDSQALGAWSIYSYDPVTLVWSRIRSQAYDTRRYWSYVDWYSMGYSQFTAINYSVDTFVELNSLTTNIGELVKIRTNSAGNWVLLRKYAESISVDWTQSYQVVGSQKGTIQLSSNLYQFSNTIYGYDGALYDGNLFDNSASIELRNILNSLKHDILIDTLRQSYLELFFSSIRYIMSEQHYVDWIFKTSFVKSQHNVGMLHQSVTYNNDNLSDFENYVAEVKPYKTKIREYVSSYNTGDTSSLSITDFDLPPVYKDGKIIPITTSIVDGQIETDNASTQLYPWKHWIDNLGFSVTEIKIVDNGNLYQSAPIVRFVGNCTQTATATAYIANGKVNRIVLTSSGKGYLKAPTIMIEGGLSISGAAARAVAIIGDSVVRSSLIKMKFDRITQSYFITQLEETETFIGTGSRLQFPLKWAPDIRIGTSTVTVNQVDELRDNYRLSIVKSTSKGYTAYSGSIIFDTAPVLGAVISVTYMKDWSLLNAADRIQYYYNPSSGDIGKDLSQLMTGIDYGGVVVTGLGFDVNYGWDSVPYSTDKWDSTDPTFDDFIITVPGSVRTFDIRYIPPAGTLLNIYRNEIRIDDPDWDSPQQTNPSAEMKTFVADGTSSIVILPDAVSVTAGDVISIRKITSDGSIKSQIDDYDTALTGGDLAYSTATGLRAEDIVIDGDGFITPTTSPAPEEVVPGQVVDTVAIKVYERPSTVSANISVDNFIANGIQNTFQITQKINSPQAVLVKTYDGVDSIILTQGEEYTVDYNNDSVTLVIVPNDKTVVSLFSFGFSGQNILDLDYFIGDGITTEFVTHAPWTSNVTGLVYIDGIPSEYELFKTDSTYDSSNYIGIRFVAPPSWYSIINFVIVEGTEQTFAITKTEKIAGNGDSLYALQNIIGNSLPIESNMIVRVNQQLLEAPNNTYFVIKSNRLTYAVDKTRVAPNSVNIEDVAVIVDNTVLTLGRDYIVDLSGISIKINRNTYQKYSGKSLIISIKRDAGYMYLPLTSTLPARIQFSQSYDVSDVIEIISSYKHDVMDIQRTSILVTAGMSFAADTVEYYNYKGITGGIVKLDRAVANENYIWITKNNVLLTPNVDYKLNSNKQSITLSEFLEDGDRISLITYNSNVLTSTIAYMQFKDMLNRTHFKRLSQDKQSTLVRDLHQNDLTIEVANAGSFDIPSTINNKPGIIEIAGERIEYFSLEGNILGRLIRGTLGTGTREVYAAGSTVQDIGSSETIPYSETLTVDRIVSDGSTTVDVAFIPAGFDATWQYKGSVVTPEVAAMLANDTVEVFAGGIRLKKEPYKVYSVTQAPESPEGDVPFDKEFTVNNDSSSIQLTAASPVDTVITVVKRTGKLWVDDSKPTRFLREKPGVWYSSLNT